MKIEKNKILTFTGKQVDPFNLQPDDINILDIAHSLSMQCRYGGHTPVHYSVAAHSTNMCVWSMQQNESTNTHLDCLMHDASEAYLTDIPKPIKERLPMIAEIEQNIINVIYNKYGIVETLLRKQLDNQAVFIEIKHFEMLNKLLKHNGREEHPSVNRGIFLKFFHELTDGKFKSETDEFQHLLDSE